MPVLPICKYGDEVLRRRTERINGIDDALLRLIEDMRDTMYAAPGIGLAANQVGLSKRLMLIDLSVGKKPGDLHVCINPEIVEMAGEIAEEEGCLSIPDFIERVRRPARVRMRYLDRNGEEREMWGEGLMARAMSHEIDHLNGSLFIDHLGALKRDLILRRIQKLARGGMWG